MARIPERTRQQRKERIVTLLKQYADGLTEREIAEHLVLSSFSRSARLLKLLTRRGY